MAPIKFSIFLPFTSSSVNENWEMFFKLISRVSSILDLRAEASVKSLKFVFIVRNGS